MAKLIEQLGLDWFVLLTGRPAFEDGPTPFPSSSEIQEKLGNLCDEEKLDDAVQYCESLLQREDDRLDKIEAKAFTLIGITGIATGFITGFAGLLLNQSNTLSYVLIPAAVLYILVVVSLMWTIFLAVKVVSVGDYLFMYPSANDILQLSDETLTSVKQERAVSLFRSFVQNNQTVNRKATFLGGAQLWFRNSIFSLLILTLLIGIWVIAAPLTTTSTGTSGSAFTSTPPVIPTNSPILTPTMTVPLSPTLTLTSTP